MAAKTSIKFHLEPNWDELEKIRKKSMLFLRSHGLSDDSIHTLSMIVSELVENGIKYGDFKKKGASVVVVIRLAAGKITVEVLNPIAESADAHLSKLDQTIRWIRGFQDPLEAYVERITEVSKKPLHDTESCIGLARIASEGNATLDFLLTENSMVRVSAVSHLDGECPMLS